MDRAMEEHRYTATSKYCVQHENFILLFTVLHTYLLDLEIYFSSYLYPETFSFQDIRLRKYISLDFIYS